MHKIHLSEVVRVVYKVRGQTVSKMRLDDAFFSVDEMFSVQDFMAWNTFVVVRHSIGKYVSIDLDRKTRRPRCSDGYDNAEAALVVAMMDQPA